MGCPSYDLLQGSGELQVAERERERESVVLVTAKLESGAEGGALQAGCVRDKSNYTSYLCTTYMHFTKSELVGAKERSEIPYRAIYWNSLP